MTPLGQLTAADAYMIVFFSVLISIVLIIVLLAEGLRRDVLCIEFETHPRCVAWVEKRIR